MPWLFVSNPLTPAVGGNARTRRDPGRPVHVRPAGKAAVAGAGRRTVLRDHLAELTSLGATCTVGRGGESASGSALLEPRVVLAQVHPLVIAPPDAKGPNA